MSDTPDTDEHEAATEGNPVALRHALTFARSLERERDEARGLAAKWRSNFWGNGGEIDIDGEDKFPWHSQK